MYRESLLIVIELKKRAIIKINKYQSMNRECASHNSQHMCCLIRFYNIFFSSKFILSSFQSSIFQIHALVAGDDAIRYENPMNCLLLFSIFGSTHTFSVYGRILEFKHNFDLSKYSIEFKCLLVSVCVSHTYLTY